MNALTLINKIGNNVFFNKSMVQKSFSLSQMYQFNYLSNFKTWFSCKMFVVELQFTAC